MARLDLTTRSRRARGIASLEFVIILPVMLLLLFGVMEYGWMLTKSGQLNNAARDGARVGAREGATNADINAAVNARLNEAGITGGAIAITNAAGVGDPVTVQITVGYDGNLELTGFALLPVPAQLQSRVTMRKEGP